jgi:ribonuclease P protein component
MEKTVPLKKNYEFVHIYKKGKFYAGKYITLYILKSAYVKNVSGINRLGITANKKVGNSVKRNRVKRLIRESYRFYEDFVAAGLDIVFVARSNEILPEYSDISKEMKFLLKKLGVFDKVKWDLQKVF